MAPPRVLITEAAVRLARQLRADHGPLLFHQSGGCCEGSAQMCLRNSSFRIGSRDVNLGEIEGCPFYVSAAQYPYWKDCQLTIDVVEGGSASFSLEAADGVRFITQSQVAPQATGATTSSCSTTIQG